MLRNISPSGQPISSDRPGLHLAAQLTSRPTPATTRHVLPPETPPRDRGTPPPEIGQLLDLAESYVLLNRSGRTQRDLLRGRTLINLFFEDSTRTRTSFELAGKRLGADVINMSVSTSSVNKGETLLDTAGTLNAMQCDLLVVRHDQSGAPNLLAQKVDAAVIKRRRRHARTPDAGAARRADHQAPQGPDRGPDGRHLRRYPALPRRPLEYSSPDHHGLPGGGWSGRRP